MGRGERVVAGSVVRCRHLFDDRVVLVIAPARVPRLQGQVLAGRRPVAAVEVLQRLVDSGNTVLVIEHNLDVIKCADWVIDLGPEGGNAGGLVVAEGTPEEVALVQGSYTGRFLRRVLSEPVSASPTPGAETQAA